MTERPDQRWHEMTEQTHQSQLAPADNKFHVGNGEDGKHYWLTPPALMAELQLEFDFNFDPCPYPLPEGFDGLACEWVTSRLRQPSLWINHAPGSQEKARQRGVRKAIAEQQKGKRVVLRLSGR